MCFVVLCLLDTLVFTVKLVKDIYDHLSNTATFGALKSMCLSLSYCVLQPSTGNLKVTVNDRFHCTDILAIYLLVIRSL